MREGRSVDDFKKVIDNKIKDTWFVDNNYMTPETLFGTKFEKYLNEKPMKTWEEQEDERYKNPFDYDR